MLNQLIEVVISMANVIGRECRFAFHLRSVPSIDRDDTHIIKEVIHLDNGEKVNNLRIINDYRRPFWITKPSKQNHKDKKEWESLKNLNRYMSTQSDLPATAGRLLGLYGDKAKYMGNIANSPYLYGTDISSTSLIKKAYMDRYPDVKTRYTVATFDTETNIYTNQILMATIAFKNKCFTAVTGNFVAGIDNPLEKLREAFVKYIPVEDVVRNTEVEVIFVENDLEVIKAVISKGHEWGPDFMAVWNLDFDMTRMIECCEDHNVDPATIFSDPYLDRKYQDFYYKRGRTSRSKENGETSVIPPEEQWHTVLSPAKFYWVDAMASFRYIRLMEPLLQGGYSLDNVLNKVINQRKLKFDKAEGYYQASWHMFMQKNYPIEYIVYNQWDVLSMLELDNETNDLCSKLPDFSKWSDFSSFNSDPKKNIDNFHFYLLQRGYVLGATPRVKDPNFDLLLGRDDWIVTLPADLMANEGMRAIEEDSTIRTNIWAHVFDSDAESSYPSDTRVLNVSKETTKRELIRIHGIPKDVAKLQNINLVCGKVNALEYGNVMFNLPHPHELLEIYRKEKGL